jgi:hypothetical protein
VWQDIRILGVKNWRSVALNGEEWRAILRKARAHRGAVAPMMMMMRYIGVFSSVVRVPHN